MTAVVQCAHLGKCYRQYGRPVDRLQDIFRTWSWQGNKSHSGATEFWALRDVSLTVGQGETVAVVGRNGSGKSTLLQLVAGTLNPSEGSVVTVGRISALLELGAGFNPEFTGIENVRLNAAILGLTPDMLNERMDSILAFSEIGDHVFQPVKKYSSGMYVRLAFSVVIHTDPSLLIVDEALAVGDAAFHAKCMEWMRCFQESGGSLLFVSHDVAAVRALCHRAIYLEHGRIKDSGTAGEVTDHYLRDVHESLNKTFTVHAVRPESASPPATVLLRAGVSPDLAARFTEFETRWVGKRQGTGGARVLLVELLDDVGQPLAVGEFNAPVQIRIYVECLVASSVSVNYKIRDRNLVAVAGADFLISEHELLSMKPGHIYIVQYETRLALKDGDYSFRLSITEPIDRHAQAVFLDIVEVALSFKVLPSPLGRIYTQVYLPNSLTIHTLQEPDSGPLP